MTAMQISTRERNILILAGLVAIVFAATRLFPAIRDVYDARQESIESVRLDMARELRLIEDTVRWQERRESVDRRRAELEMQIFSGNTIPLIEAAIQRDLTLYARESDMGVASTRLAERLQTDGWLLISQEMSFRTNNASNTLSFLNALDKSTPRLYVRDFSLNRTRNQYNGSITVVGFARSEGLVDASQESTR